MRCLFCNKKLSLLKLAKGDSFCSAEHFDAYQLQLSKDAIDRLRSVASEVAPKTPLVVNPPALTPPDETPPELPQENGALARLSSFALPAKREVPAPPYAPFASAALPAFTLNPPYPIANGPETSVAVEPSRTLAYPVHDAEEIACILNLYLQLSLSGTEPKDWSPERQSADITPESFRMEISQPPFGITPEFPEIENLEAGGSEAVLPDDSELPEHLSPVEPLEVLPTESVPLLLTAGETEPEGLAPAEPVSLVEAVAPPVEVHPVETEAVLPTESEPLLLTPGVTELPEVERLAPAEPVSPVEAVALPVEAHPVEAEAVLPSESAPLLLLPGASSELPEHLAPAEPVSPVEAAAPQDEAHTVEALPFDEAAPSTTPVLPAEPATIAPIEPPAPRVPFLVAPSFNPRAGAPIRLHSGASSVPKGVHLSPILEKDSLPRPDSSEGIPNSTRFATSNSFCPQDSAVRLAGVPALEIEPASVLPKAKEQACGEAWSPSNREIARAVPAFDRKLVSISPVDYKMREPASMMVSPNASRLAKSDPQGLLAGASLDVVTLFAGILEVSPRGQKPLFVDPPAEAVESAWKAVPLPFPSRKPLPSAWEVRTSYRSLPDPIASGGESRMLPLEAHPYEPRCIKIERVEKARLPLPYSARNVYRSSAWPEADARFVRVGSEPSVAFTGSTMWPRAAAMPKGKLKRGSGEPRLRWQARPAAPEALRTVKFLPSRDGAVLPQPKRWERLDAVPC